jgi:hypothetical protein
MCSQDLLKTGRGSFSAVVLGTYDKKVYMYYIKYKIDSIPKQIYLKIISPFDWFLKPCLEVDNSILLHGGLNPA